MFDWAYCWRNLNVSLVIHSVIFEFTAALPSPTVFAKYSNCIRGLTFAAIVATVKSRSADSGSGGESLGVMTVPNVSFGVTGTSFRCCYLTSAIATVSPAPRRYLRQKPNTRVLDIFAHNAAPAFW